MLERAAVPSAPGVPRTVAVALIVIGANVEVGGGFELEPVQPSAIAIRTIGTQTSGIRI